MARAAPRRMVSCYLCRHRFEVSGRAMSTACPKCNRAIKIEDVKVTSYLPVTNLQTCGRITITKKGRVVARHIQAGEGIDCEGVLEGRVESDGQITFGARAQWKGQQLLGPSLQIADGARLLGAVTVPWRSDAG